MTPRLRFWLLLAALVLFARMFQTRVLWPEESLPLAAAQQMLAGRVLYRDLWFDKPPLLAWFYAGLLRLAGSSGYSLRLAGVLYILLVTWTGFALARRLWDEAAARWTAFFLAFFSGFYIHSAAVPLAADLLLVLPHLAAFYFLICGRPWATGLCAGLAVHVHSKAMLILAAAVAWILVERASRQLLPLLAGFALAAGAGLGLVAFSGGWNGYVEQVWRWGASYAGAAFSDRPWLLGLERILHYLGFHAALVAGLLGALWSKPPACLPQRRWQISLWLAISFLGVLAGGRFFPRYFFQILPPLAVAAGAGWQALSRRRVLLVLLAATLAVPAVRFGRVNLWLVLGRRFTWRDTAIDASSRRAAAEILARTRPTDRIFVWGFRPEIYFYSRRPAASRYLESQPLTGVLADRHLERSDPFLPEQAQARRAELARQLAGAPPAAIIDGLGPYNPNLAIGNYPELAAVLRRYRLTAELPGALVYLRAEPKIQSPLAVQPLRELQIHLVQRNLVMRAVAGDVM